MDSPFTPVAASIPPARSRRPAWILPALAVFALVLVGYAWYAGFIPFWNPFQKPLEGDIIGFSVERFGTEEGQPVQGAFRYDTRNDRVVPLQPQRNGVIITVARATQVGRLAYVQAEGGLQSVVVDTVPSTAPMAIATSSGASFNNLLFTGDGSRLAFSAIRLSTSTESMPAVMLAERAGDGWKVVMVGGGVPLAFSPDGTALLAFDGSVVHAYAIDGSKRPTLDTNIPIPTANMFFSPDGHYAAYLVEAGITVLPMNWQGMSAGESFTIRGDFVRRGAFNTRNELLLLDKQGTLHRYTGIAKGKPRENGQFKLALPVPYALVEWIVP